MTGLEKILEQINLDAKEATRQQLLQAQEQADQLLSEADAQIAAEQSAHQEQLELETQTILERAKSSAELEGRKALLRTKQGLMNQTIADAKEQLQQLPKEEYFAVLLKLAEQYANGQTAKLALNATDLQQLPEEFAGKLPAGVTLSETPVAIKNGFILILDGIDINCSFDALFNDKMEELQDKTASILFQ